MDTYTLVLGAPSLDEYLALRAAAGLSPKRPEQGAAAISGSWSFCHVRTSDGTVVAMGRAIGDGGWYFHISDMATHPDHQRRGLGRRVLDWLIADIEERAPTGAFISLIADPPGVPLYRAAGMRDTTPSIAMGLLSGGVEGEF